MDDDGDGMRPRAARQVQVGDLGGVRPVAVAARAGEQVERSAKA